MPIVGIQSQQWVEGTWVGKGMGLGHPTFPSTTAFWSQRAGPKAGLRTGPIPTDRQTEELLHGPRGLRHGYSWLVPRHRPPWHQQPVPDEVGCGEGRLVVGMVNHKSHALRVSLCSLAISTEMDHLEDTVSHRSDCILLPSNIAFVVFSC